MKEKCQILRTIKDSVNDQSDIQQMLSAIKLINSKSFTVNSCISSAINLSGSAASSLNLVVFWFKKESQYPLNEKKIDTIFAVVKEVLSLYR